MWFNVVKAIAARSLFAIHAFVAIWRVVDIRGGETKFWYLATSIGLLIIEGFISICLRRGREMKWFCPSVFLYLCCIIPPTWMMELDLVYVRRQLAVTSSNNVTLTHRREKLSQIPGLQITIDLELPAEMWAKLLEQFLLVNLVLGRWLLPKGGLTRGQLSQLLLVYIGMAADIVELFEAFKEDVVNTNMELTCAVLALWSWSLMQFTLVLTATKARKPRLGMDNSTAKDYNEGERSCCRPLKRFCAMDTWAIMTTIIFQDGPFLCLRLLLIFRFNVISYLNIFFTCKNSLVLVLQIYRMSVLSVEERKRKRVKVNCQLQLSGESVEAIGLALPEVTQEVYCSSEQRVPLSPQRKEQHVVVVDDHQTPQLPRYSPATEQPQYHKSQTNYKRKKASKKVKTCASQPVSLVKENCGVFEEADRDSVYLTYSQNKTAPWSDVSFTLSSPLKKKIGQRRHEANETRERHTESDEEEAKPLLTV